MHRGVEVLIVSYSDWKKSVEILLLLVLMSVQVVTLEMVNCYIAQAVWQQLIYNKNYHLMLQLFTKDHY